MRAVLPPEFVDPDPFTVFPVIIMLVALFGIPNCLLNVMLYAGSCACVSWCVSDPGSARDISSHPPVLIRDPVGQKSPCRPLPKEERPRLSVCEVVDPSPAPCVVPITEKELGYCRPELITCPYAKPHP